MLWERVEARPTGCQTHSGWFTCSAAKVTLGPEARTAHSTMYGITCRSQRTRLNRLLPPRPGGLSLASELSTYLKDSERLDLNSAGNYNKKVPADCFENDPRIGRELQ